MCQFSAFISSQPIKDVIANTISCQKLLKLVDDVEDIASKITVIFGIQHD